MATNTYVALATQTLGSATASVTFSSIPSGYTDLRLVMQARTDTGNNVDYAVVRLNNDATSLYSRTEVYGDGSSAGSGRAANFLIGISSTAQGGNTDIKTMSTMDFMNYSNTTTFKSVLYRQASAAQITLSGVGLYRSTSAISTITLTPFYGTWQAGSTFTIYGIAATSVGAKATGGTIYSDADYFYHVFAASGTFTPSSAISADVLVVAGGGGGGGQDAGGGGAGGLLAFTSQSLASGTGYTCTVGAGGNGGSAGSFTAPGSQGSNSQFAALTASVGGGAASSGSAGPAGTGGSGGGAGQNSGTTVTGGSATSGQGYAGGNATGGSPNYGSGGGGGAGAIGSDGTSTVGGNGGVGTTTYNSWLAVTGMGEYVGSSYYIAGGGGGGVYTFATPNAVPGLGGYGGGGNAGITGGADQPGTKGKANTGGGGGGATRGTNNAGTQGAGGAGGSGLVIVRYAK